MWEIKNSNQKKAKPMWESSFLVGMIKLKSFSFYSKIPTTKH